MRAQCSSGAKTASPTHERLVQHAVATATGSWLFEFQPSEYRRWGYIGASTLRTGCPEINGEVGVL
eukprot:scaffold9122_cov24-Phaeocystis_antarctica.AAC.2